MSGPGVVNGAVADLALAGTTPAVRRLGTSSDQLGSVRDIVSTSGGSSRPHC